MIAEAILPPPMKPMWLLMSISKICNMKDVYYVKYIFYVTDYSSGGLYKYTQNPIRALFKLDRNQQNV